MIIQELTRYYDILAQEAQSVVTPFGYDTMGVSFALNLSAEGELLDVFPLSTQEKRGKAMVERPLMMAIPAQVKRSVNIAPNFLCDNSVYVLGLADEEKLKTKRDPLYALHRFEAFCRFNLELLAEARCAEADAAAAFLSAYHPDRAAQNAILSRYREALVKGSNLVFKLEGSAGYLHDAPELRRVWERYLSRTASERTGQCLATGETGPIARLHPATKGVKGGQPTGATLVGFNAAAYESYRRAQGLNAPTSEQAVFAYSTALNYLLSSQNPNRKIYLSDTTVVYWAGSTDRAYATVFQGLFSPDWVEEPSEDGGRDAAAERRLAEIAQKVKSGAPLDVDNLLSGLDKETRFYVLGLAPNAGRLSVRFFYRDAFGKAIEKIMAHYRDLEIVKEREWQTGRITVRNILDETVSKKASDSTPPPLMAGAVLRAILNNTPYPAALFYAILNRVRADMDDKDRRIYKINWTRAAVIKAYLTRKYRNQDQNPILEVLCMSLNERATHPAYLLGRLFAVLEKAQQEAIGEVNASIKDRYFTSACASPASVFPMLLRLSQHHITKAEYGYNLDRRIQDILNLLDVESNPIPARLTLDEQGVFILGYYHQRVAFYTPKNNHPLPETESASKGE
jgi:CRISPR-associated protein Csd1